MLALFVTAVVAAAASGACNEPGWDSHQLRVVATQQHSAINATNLPDSFYGVEGGHVVQVGAALFTVITEFTAPPLWVPSRIALWRADLPHATTGDVDHQHNDDAVVVDGDEAVWPSNWTRVRTLFTSTGTTLGPDCHSRRASLGSSVALLLNRETDTYEVYYVGFMSCNDTNFTNRDAQIYRAVSTVSGPAGVGAPYTDVGVVLNVTGGQSWWEGVVGVDSMAPYWLGPGRGYAAFYGSGGRRPAPVPGDPPVTYQEVGLALAARPEGPWVRAGRADNGTGPELNPTNLSAVVPNIEQPMTTRLSDGSFVSFWDALTRQGQGQVGYSYSADGVTWKPECSQLLDVVHGPAGAAWVRPTNVTRTPQGAVELLDDATGKSKGLLLSFSAYDAELPPHPHMPWITKPYFADTHHESMGFVRLEWSTNGGGE